MEFEEIMGKINVFGYVFKTENFPKRANHTFFPTSCKIPSRN